MNKQVYINLTLEHDMVKQRHFDIPKAEIFNDKVKDNLTKFNYFSTSAFGEPTYKAKSKAGHIFALTIPKDDNVGILSRYKTDVEWNDEQSTYDMSREKAEKKRKAELAKRKRERRELEKKFYEES